MGDLIQTRVDFAFFTCAFALFLWIAIDPRRALRVVSLGLKTPTIGETVIVRAIAILNSPILAFVLMWHVWRLIRAHLGLPE